MSGHADSKLPEAQRTIRPQIIRGGSALLLRQLCSVPLNMIGIAIASFFLTPEDFAQQSWLLSTTVFMFLFIDLGCAQSVVRLSTSSKHLLRQITTLRVSMALILAIATLIISSGTALPQSASAPLLFSAILMALLQAERAIAATSYQRSLEWSRLAKIEIVEISTMNVTLAVAAGLLRSWWCFPLSIAARWIAGIVLLRLARRDAPRVASDEVETPPNAATGQLREVLRFGLPLQLTALSAILNGFANPVIVGSLVGAHSVGLLQWSQSLCQAALAPLQQAPSFLFSIFSRHHREGGAWNTTVIQATLDLAAFFSCCAVVALTVGLSLALELLQQLKWLPAVPSLFAFGLASCLWFPLQLLAALVTAAGKSAIWLRANLVGSVCVWALGLAATSLFGALGFPLAWAIATIIPLGELRRHAAAELKSTVDLGLAWGGCCVVGAHLALFIFLGTQTLTRNEFWSYFGLASLGVFLLQWWIFGERVRGAFQLVRGEVNEYRSSMSRLS